MNNCDTDISGDCPVRPTCVTRPKRWNESDPYGRPRGAVAISPHYRVANRPRPMSKRYIAHVNSALADWHASIVFLIKAKRMSPINRVISFIFILKLRGTWIREPKYQIPIKLLECFVGQ